MDVPMPTTQSERMVAARVGKPDPTGHHLLVLARDPTGYASLARAISTAQQRGGVKGRPVYDGDELAELANGHWLVLTGCRKGPVRAALASGLDSARRALADLIDRFGRDNVVVELTYALDPLADERYDALTLLAEEAGLPVVATTAAHYHGPPRRPLATAMAAVRARSNLDEMDGWLPAFADQHLRSGAEMAARFARWPGVVERAASLGDELAFPLRLIAPQLPPFPVPPGHTEMTYLAELARAGAVERYGDRKPEERERAFAQIEHELAIIDELGFPGYFLVVWDIVRFCHSRGILCQGRGSAANSAVCYALQITAVDAVRYELLFERFLSPDRDGPPDIDVDIESDRREEAIQYVYGRYDRDHAAQVADVITYRPKSAIRDIAKALGYSPGQQDAWSKEIEQSYYWAPDLFTREDEAPTSVQSEVPQRVVDLAAELQNAPRHMGIHTGGMVICDRPVVEVCPVEWGRMPERTVLQWDKDDCAAIGLVKFDLLGLGMLSALHYCFEFVEQWFGVHYGLHEVPPEDPLVYEMLQRADTIGVFQIESRAQMATLPRLRPEKFYDLVIEIALIRPGPIQGESVHPYIRRKHKLEKVTYPHPKLKKHLEKTLGVPLFQEQLMQLAIDAAGCSPSEADQVRRAMGSKRSHERMEALRHRLYDGMARNGIVGAAADDIYLKIKSFAIVRLRREPLDQLRLLGLRLQLAEALPPGCILRIAAQRAADGFLLAADACARRQATRRRRARPAREPLACGRRARSGAGWLPGRPALYRSGTTATGGAAGIVQRAHHQQRAGRADRRRAESRRCLYLDGRPDPARGSHRRPGRGPGYCRSIRLLRPVPTDCALGRRRGRRRPPWSVERDRLRRIEHAPVADNERG